MLKSFQTIDPWGVTIGVWKYGLRIAAIGVLGAVFLFVSVGPTAYEFRLLLDTDLGFLASAAWPLAAVVIVFVLRNCSPTLYADALGRGRTLQPRRSPLIGRSGRDE